MKPITYLLFILLSYSYVVEGQCDISNIELTPIECDTDNTFSLSIDLMVTDPSSEQFLLLANGALVGSYSYSDLPITLDGLLGDCITSYQFVVRDAVNPGCSNTATLHPICCDIECMISVTNDSPKTCNTNTTISFPLDIDYQGILNPTTFTVQNTAGFAVSYHYTDLPVSVENFPAGSAPIIDYIICDDGSCCDTFSFINPCVCSIVNTSGTIINCSETDSTYFVEVDFDRGMSSDSFLMGFNIAFIGTFAYLDLPVTVGPFEFSDEDIEFLVVDQQSALCFNSVELGVVENCLFDCEISNFDANVTKSLSTNYDINFDFDVANVDPSSTFEVFLDGISIATLPLALDGYTLTNIPLNCDTIYELHIFLAGSNGCESVLTLDDITCCTCSLSNFEAEVICDPEAELSYDFLASNGSEAYLLVVGLDTLGPFLYNGGGDIPDISMLPNGPYDLTIIDANNQDCSASTSIDLDCIDDSCQLLDFSYEYSICQGDLFFIEVVLESEGLTSESFLVFINDSLVGSYAYIDSMVTIGPLDLPCESDHPIVLLDSQGSSCIIDGMLSDVPCCDLSCMWTSVETSTTCVSLDSIEVQINGVSNQADSALFSIRYDANLLGIYRYDEQPLTIAFPYTDARLISMTDLIDTGCIVESLLDFDCDSTCVLGEIAFEITFCEDSLFNIIFDFEGSKLQDSFELSGNDFSYGTFAYDELPLLVENLEADTAKEYSFTASNIGAICTSRVDVGTVMCEPNSTSKTTDDLIHIQQKGNLINIGTPWPTARLSVYTISGELIGSQQISRTANISTEHYQSGLFFFAIETDHGIITKKVVVVK